MSNSVASAPPLDMVWNQKEHEADRWIAASALWLGLPLVAHDGIFRDVPGLELLTTLS